MDRPYREAEAKNEEAARDSEASSQDTSGVKDLSGRVDQAAPELLPYQLNSRAGAS